MPYSNHSTPFPFHRSAFERFRAILHEGEIDKRVQFMIEGLFAVRKAGFEASGHPSLKPGLDLVEAADQITHEIELFDNTLAAHMELDVFKLDPEYEQHEAEYAAIKREILGEESEDEEGSEGSSGSEESDEEDEGQAGQGQGATVQVRPRALKHLASSWVRLSRTSMLG